LFDTKVFPKETDNNVRIGIICLKKYLVEMESFVSFGKRSTLEKSFINFHDIRGRSIKMKQLFSNIKKVASSPTATVLVQGESGTGKELIARAIHNSSKNATKPFIEINCTALPENLLETELFGYEAGAYTDAKRTKKGLLELADGGTFFLDEIGDLNINLQAKLLKVLDEKSFRRIGGVRNIEVTMRIITATNKNLSRLVRKKLFREDLYFRLAVITLNAPPLRERNLDVLFLAEYFMDQYNKEHNRQLKGFSQKAKESILSYPWPGNVRELKNSISRAVVLSSSNIIEACDLNLGDGHIVKDYPIKLDLKDNIEINIPPQGISLFDIEKSIIKQALKMSQGNKAQTARLLQISRETLKYRLRKYKINI
jgi:two-component system, NtrC family, response regulator AtoC